MMIVLGEAKQLGLINSVAIGLSFESMRGETNCYANEETFRRI